jgi:biopolymer transport protein ExbD
MKKFRKIRATSSIPTSSLPDIIFMLLFFFMVVTVLRKNDVLVEQKFPSAEELQKLENDKLVTYIHIGKPIEKGKYGSEPIIQVDGFFKDAKDIGQYILSKQSNIPEYLVPQMTVSLQIDSDVQMGIVSDVQQELRRVNARKVIYNTKLEKRN